MQEALKKALEDYCMAIFEKNEQKATKIFQKHLNTPGFVEGASTLKPFALALRESLEELADVTQRKLEKQKGIERM